LLVSARDRHSRQKGGHTGREAQVWVAAGRKDMAAAGGSGVVCRKEGRVTETSTEGRPSRQDAYAHRSARMSQRVTELPVNRPFSCAGWEVK